MRASVPFKWFEWSEGCSASYQPEKWVNTLRLSDMAGSPRSCAETWQSERGLGGGGSGRADTQAHNQQSRSADEQHVTGHWDTSEDTLRTSESASHTFYSVLLHNARWILAFENNHIKNVLN